MIRDFVLHSPPRRLGWVVFLGLGCVAAASLGHLLRPVTLDGVTDLPGLPFDALARWDAGWYGAIARDGYFLDPARQSPVAYFPLYPLVMRALTLLGLNRWVAGSLVTFTSAVGALLLAHRWARRVVPAHATTVFLLLASYPYACYLYGVVYSDALFLLLVVGAFVCLESDAPVAAALLGALATACRPVAPALVVGLTVRSLERRRRAGLPIRTADLVPALAGLGLAAYMAFLAHRFGDPMAFAHVHGAPGWDQQPGWHTWLKREFFEQVRSQHWTVALRLGAHAFVTLGALALVPAVVRRLGWGYGLYCLLALALPAVSSKDFQGMGRYAIAAFPLCVPVAAWLDRWAGLREPVLLALGGLLALCAGLLGTGAYLS
ncbi:MAG: hypothetical protein INH41_14950 [Myxococcaceae bacterium]|nr:hypothetical protein [Myxococcaceae bacterium]MCA3013678.1 hypothetical protein [Myxococcaceae bacterium]